MGRRRNATNRNLPPNLYPNSNGYYYYRNPISGERKGVGKDKAAAIIEARSANAALAGMRKSTLTDWVSGKAGYSLAEWVPLYKDMWAEMTSPAKSTLRAATGYLERIAAAEFAWMKLPDIGAEHIAKFIDDVSGQSGVSTARLMRSRVQDVFRMAETKGYIDAGKNPAAATYRPKKDVSRERLSFEQFKLIHAAAPLWLKRAMELALVASQRREDIAGLQFSDYAEGYLHVVQGKSQGKIRLKLDGRIVLSAYGKSIHDVIQGCRDLIKTKYMVHHTAYKASARPGDPVSLNGISNKFAAIRDSVGIKAADGRTPPSFHEIRSLSERMYRDEYGAEFAQAMLGHKNARMTTEYDDLRGQGFKLIAAK